MEAEVEQGKVVIIGDGFVGKTSLVITINTKEFPVEYTPTVAESRIENVTVDGRPFQFCIWDTAGGEDYWRLRPLSYVDADAFLLCFDICDRESFKHIASDWLPEVTHFMPHVPVVLVGNKSDLRDEKKTDDYKKLYSSSYWKTFVRGEEGEALAKKYNLFSYAECSALLLSSIDEVVTNMVRACRANKAGESSLSKKEHRKRKKEFYIGDRIQSWIPLRLRKSIVSNPPPNVPPDVIHIEPKTSTFAEDLRKVLYESKYTDVQFIFQAASKISDQTVDRPASSNNQPLLAHKVILSATSSAFYDIFMHSEKKQKNHLIFDEIALYSSDQCSFPIKSEKAGTKSAISTELASFSVNKSVSRESFGRVVQFLYTGLPGDFASDEHLILEVKHLAHTLNLPLLENICVNELQQQVVLNPSIGSYHNDDTGVNMVRYFLNKPSLCDVIFKVENCKIYAHKVLLTARCDVMATMFQGAFREGRADVEIPLPDISKGQFLALLGYLYTDHVTFDDVDPQDVLVLADRYILPRLVTLCEIHISSQIQHEMAKKKDVTRNVIHFVTWSKIHNAHQLHKWCLHYIACHFEVFESSEDSQKLDCEDVDYITRHRRPPEGHLEKGQGYGEAKEEHDMRVEAHQHTTGLAERERRSNKCCIM